MRKIVLSLEYGGYPIWIYDEQDMIDYVDIPDEWVEDENLDTTEIESKLIEVQRLYNSGFIDNETTFEFIGFQGDNEKIDRMNKLLDEVRVFIKEHLPNEYSFEDRVITYNELKGF